MQAGVRRTAKTFRHALEDRIEEKLPHSPHPVLVVRGSRDPLAPQRWVEELTRLLPRGELRVIRGAGHTPHYDAPHGWLEWSVGSWTVRTHGLPRG